MFDIGLFELLVVGGVGLVVIGPEKLPGTLRTGALWFGRIKRSIINTRREIEQQIGADEIRRELRNEEIMASLEKLRETREQLEADINKTVNTIEHDDKYEPDDHHDEHGNYTGHLHPHDSQENDSQHNEPVDIVEATAEVVESNAAGNNVSKNASEGPAKDPATEDQAVAKSLAEQKDEYEKFAREAIPDHPSEEHEPSEKHDKPAQS